jgi:hypothetical protein
MVNIATFFINSNNEMKNEIALIPDHPAVLLLDA